MMKSINNLSVILVLFLVNSFGQIPDTLWTKTYGGISGDIGFAVQQTVDSGYIITGRTYSFGAGKSDVWLIKADKFGNEEWNKTFGKDLWDWGGSVLQTNDSGYIIIGSTYSFSKTWDVWLIKTDKNGNKQWDKNFGGIYDDKGHSIVQTSDSGFVLAGWSESYGPPLRDFWLIKTDKHGNEQWNKKYGGSNSEEARSVIKTSDSGFIILGYTKSYGSGNSDLWLVKTDESGNEEWNKTFGGIYDDKGFSVKLCTDSGFIIAGYTTSYGSGGSNFWVIKTDESGNEIWAKTFGGSSWDIAYSVQNTLDTGYVIVGWSESYSMGDMDLWILKIDKNGNGSWNKLLGGIAADAGYSVEQTFDGGLIITGHTDSYGAGSSDVWLIKLKPIVVSMEGNFTSSQIKFSLLQNYPNPFNPTTKIRYTIPQSVIASETKQSQLISLKVYDVLGNEIATLVNEEKPAGSYEVEFNSHSGEGRNLTSGIYFYQLKAVDPESSSGQGFVETMKMILLK